MWKNVHVPWVKHPVKRIWYRLAMAYYCWNNSLEELSGNGLCAQGKDWSLQGLEYKTGPTMLLSRVGWQWLQVAYCICHSQQQKKKKTGWWGRQMNLRCMHNGAWHSRAAQCNSFFPGNLQHLAKITLPKIKWDGLVDLAQVLLIASVCFIWTPSRSGMKILLAIPFLLRS